MKLAACIFVKVFQIIFTVAAIIVKKLSERFAERFVLSNKKNLSEWMLLNSISITPEADDFGDFAYIGYAFIATILLLSRFKEKKSNYHITEIILLCFGVLFFIFQAMLIFGVLEQLPDDILPFSYGLGALTLVCVLLFLIDLFFFKTMTITKTATSQTDFESMIEKSPNVIQVSMIKMEKPEQCCRPITAESNENYPKYLRTDL